jgi:hypothetical protein
VLKSNLFEIYSIWIPRIRRRSDTIAAYLLLVIYAPIFMRILVFLCFSILFIVSSSSAYADAFVCMNQQGKKVFSSISCEQKGMKAASVDFPVKPGQAISAVVIAPQIIPSDLMVLPGGSVVKKRAPGEWPLEKPVVYFLISMLVAMGVLFTMIFLRFFKAHHRKLSLDR